MADAGSFEEQTFGRYRLLGRLGEGGMAEVFKAKSFGVEGFEKVVVIKRILPRLVRHKAFVDMFVREAKVAVRLSHANVVQVFDLGRVEGEQDAPPSYYMAMEYVAGMDLSELLARCRKAGIRPPAGLALYVASEVAKGLDHAHRRRDDANQPLGLVHRDVSPQNILLSWEGEVKVTDFGIAKARDSLDALSDDSRMRVLKGKFAYMSPEQARSEPVDQRSDLYSLGVVLYELLSGVNPFRADQSLETLRRAREAECPPLALVSPETPAPLVALVEQAMAAEPTRRFEDAARMHEACLSMLYRSGTRFGAADLGDFLQRVRALPPAEEVPRRSEGTPVAVPSPAPSLVIDVEHEPGSLIVLREVTALCVRRRDGTASLPGALRERIEASCRRLGGRLLVDDGTDLVALFGLGEADLRDTAHATRAAGAAVRAAAELGAEVGVGVQVGRVRLDGAGELVPGGEEEALTAGARRLASAASGRALLSAEAARQVRGQFGLEAVGEAFRLGEPRAAQEIYGKFIGRRDELSHLGTLLGNASRRQLQLVSVEGTAGIGKTRLLHEVDRRLRRGDFNVGVYVAPCSPRGREAPLSAVTAMLQVLCGVGEGDGPDRARQVAPSLRALGLLDDEVDAVLAQLGVPERGSEGPQVLRSAFLKTLASLAEDRVHVFAWDNAQWLDDVSASLLTTSLRRLGGHRVALLLSGREGMPAVFEGLPNHERVRLGELSHDEALRLMASRLEVQELPSSLIDFCLRRAGGHPLFLEEILRELTEAGSVRVEQGAITHLELRGDTIVPRPLRAVMAGRVERLEVSEQVALQAAAVLGESFEREVAATLAGSEGEASLASLVLRDLVRESSDGALVFASPLLRDVVLDALPVETRRQLHARAASLLEESGALIERVAEHLQEAGQHHEAGQLWTRSAQRRLAARQMDAAVSEGLRALALLDLDTTPVPDLIELLRVVASALDWVRIAPDAPRLMQGALERLAARATPTEQVAARVEVARALGAVSRFDEALATLDPVARAELPDDLTRQLHLAEGELRFRQGDFGRARAALDQIEMPAASDPLASRVLFAKAQANAVADQRKAALDLLALVPPVDTPAHASRLEKLRGLAHFFAHDHAQAAAASARGAEFARQGGLVFETAIHLHNLADALLFQADYPRAYAALQQSLALCEQHGISRLAQQNRMYLGYLDALQGLPGGEAILRDGIAHAEQHGYVWDIINGRFLLGRLLEDMGLLRAAAAEFTACRAHAHDARHPLVADCDEALTRIDHAIA